MYADDADRAFEGSLAIARRERAGLHERCEQLALGGDPHQVSLFGVES